MKRRPKFGRRPRNPYSSADQEVTACGSLPSQGRHLARHRHQTKRKLIMRMITAAAILALLGGGAGAQTLDELKRDGSNTDNVLTYGMAYTLHRSTALNPPHTTTANRRVHYS